MLKLWLIHTQCTLVYEYRGGVIVSSCTDAPDGDHYEDEPTDYPDMQTIRTGLTCGCEEIIHDDGED